MSYFNERAYKLGFKETSIDRLSALPDSIIIHILSLLDHDVKKAAVTSVLSKRWQFIWSEMPRLHFYNSSLEIDKMRDFVSWVGRTLLLRSSGTHLESFHINFYYHECFASELNAFIRFALRSKAKELYLTLYSGSHLYTLPQVLYSDSSLRYLHVEQCVLDPRGTIKWRSMTRLCIHEANLDKHVIHKVISGCPILRTLDLKSCWGFERLDLNSESLDMLHVSVREDKDTVAPLLEISAPYLRTLYIGFNPVKRKMQLTNVPLLVDVNIYFNVFDDSVEVMNNTMELFEKIRHVKELRLEGACVEVLSELVVHGRRLPQSGLLSLGIDTPRYEDCIPGILGLLESSPNLDTLLIESCGSSDCYEESVRPWSPLARDDLVCDLLKLKTVRLFDYADPNLGGEPMLTLARILLKRAPALELMVIDAQENLTEFSSEFANMSQTVLSYPKSSEKAVIHLRQ